MKTEIQTTIDNLRELASHAEAYYEANDPSRFNMMAFKTLLIEDQNGTKSLKGKYDRGEHVPKKYECQTACCLIGIADLAGMGSEVQGSYWALGRALFPTFKNNSMRALYTATLEWKSLFGSHLPSDIVARVAGLRLAADQLQRTGRYIPA